MTDPICSIDGRACTPCCGLWKGQCILEHGDPGAVTMTAAQAAALRARHAHD